MWNFALATFCVLFCNTTDLRPPKLSRPTLANMGSINVDDQSFDAIILGAGLSGLCALHHLRKRFPSWRIRVLEAAPNVGGVWWYNCYPGARVDTESLSYAFSFDKDIIDQWSWKDTFSTQADMLKYVCVFPPDTTFAFCKIANGRKSQIYRVRS